MQADQNPPRLELLLAEHAALRRVAMLVANGLPATTLFERVCEELGALLEVKSTDMIRFDPDGSATVVGAWALKGEPSFPVGDRIPVEGESVTAKLRRSGRPERVDDYNHVKGELAARLRAVGMRSVVGAPITVAGRLWGAIMVTSGEPSAFPPDTEQRICNFAELVTAALANVDAREKLAASRARLLEAEDAARRRIERDLHDGAQQRLVSLALRLRLLQRRLNQDPAVVTELAAARDELDRALEELRDLARGIHPSVLTTRGLNAALTALATRSPVPVDLHVADCARLPQAVETTAYFIVAEGLANALKHARCDAVEVRVHAEDSGLSIEVRDDGCGGTDPGAGTGLRGLADRVNALDGTLEIDGPPNGGTRISAWIPVPSTGAAVAGDRRPTGAAAG